MGQNESDTMIRVTPDTSKKLLAVAISKGMTKKGYLKQLADKEFKKIKDY